jgi:hypothetical protein
MNDPIEPQPAPATETAATGDASSPLEAGSPHPMAESEYASPPIHEPLLSPTAPAFDDMLSTMPAASSTTKRRGIPGSLWLLAILIPYAIVTTLAVLYLLQQQHGQKPPHILESIPDQGLYEDFLEGRRRETIPPLSKAGDKPPPTKVIPANETLPPEMPPLRLNETRVVGDLAVMPIEVTRQRLRYDYKNGQQQVTGDEALVLRLQVRNEGKLVFRPEDETFNRAFLDNRVPVYTYLQAGPQRYYGAISDPSQERLSLASCNSLAPGETGIIHITAVRGSDGKTPVTEALATAQPLVWRVQLRRGKEEVSMSNGRKRSVWVTTVIPITFQPGEVREPKSDK